jgi:hypothetical protein
LELAADWLGLEPLGEAEHRPAAVFAHHLIVALPSVTKLQTGDDITTHSLAPRCVRPSSDKADSIANFEPHGARRSVQAGTFRSARRFLSAEVGSIESSFNNSQQETKSVEAFLDSASPNHLQPPEAEPDENAISEQVARDFLEFKRQSMTALRLV